MVQAGSGITEIVTTRVFDAPRERVFEAFANPAYLTQWWGPQGFTNTFSEFDIRPAGKWRFVMHGPDGKDYANVSEFVEVIRPERIVFDHLVEPRFRMTMAFEDEGGQTRLTWRMALESGAERVKLEDFIRQANEQNFDRLAACLAQMP